MTETSGQQLHLKRIHSETEVEMKNSSTKCHRSFESITAYTQDYHSFGFEFMSGKVYGYCTQSFFSPVLVTFSGGRVMNYDCSLPPEVEQCVSATLVLYMILLRPWIKKQHRAAVFVDLSKAFDSVNHQLLSERLLDIGISDKVVNWFRNYLTDSVCSVMVIGPA